MTKISEAREKYEEKVCEEYLGIPESYCTDEFSKLISNMKAGIMAVKGSPKSVVLDRDVKREEGLKNWTTKLSNKGWSKIREYEERKWYTLHPVLSKDGTVVKLDWEKHPRKPGEKTGDVLLKSLKEE